jgi:prophage regulatory protein
LYFSCGIWIFGDIPSLDIMKGTTMHHPHDSVAQQLNKAQLLERLSLSERALENMVKDGRFPPPVRIGKFVYWSEVAVRKWQERIFAAQENWDIY